MRELIDQIDDALGLDPPSLFVPECLARQTRPGSRGPLSGAAAIGRLRPQFSPPVTPDKLNVLCAHRSFCSSKAARLIGYTPRVDYSAGLTSTLAWMREMQLLPSQPAVTTAPVAAG